SANWIARPSALAVRGLITRSSVIKKLDRQITRPVAFEDHPNPFTRITLRLLATEQGPPMAAASRRHSARSFWATTGQRAGRATRVTIKKRGDRRPAPPAGSAPDPGAEGSWTINLRDQVPATRECLLCAPLRAFGAPGPAPSGSSVRPACSQPWS